MQIKLEEKKKGMFMAKDDYYVIVYQVLEYLYKCLKNGVEPEEKLLRYDSKYFNINKKYWAYIIQHMIDEGFIENVEVHEYIGMDDVAIFDLGEAQITPAGIGYLLDNNLLAKARKALHDANEIKSLLLG